MSDKVYFNGCWEVPAALSSVHCLWFIRLHWGDDCGTKTLTKCFGGWTLTHSGQRSCCTLVVLQPKVLNRPLTLWSLSGMLALLVSLALNFTFAFFLIHVLWHRFSLIIKRDGKYVFVIDFFRKICLTKFSYLQCHFKTLKKIFF